MVSGILSLIIGCSSQGTTTSPPPVSSPSGSVSISSSPSPSAAPVSPGGPASPSGIQVSADQIMQNILVSLNNDDYDGFSRDFGQAAKNAISQKSFEQLYNEAKTAIGDYQSVLFVSDTIQNGINAIMYVAQFSKEPAGVTVTLALQSINGGYQVQGLGLTLRTC